MLTLWPGLTGGEIIDLPGRLRGGIGANRKDALIERFGLDPAKKARAYSKGNRQKVALIAALAVPAVRTDLGWSPGMTAGRPRRSEHPRCPSCVCCSK